MVDKGLLYALKRQQETIIDFSSFSEGIGNLIQDNDKDIVLLINEIDKSSNNKVFLQFLGLLRNKYLEKLLEEISLLRL